MQRSFCTRISVLRSTVALIVVFAVFSSAKAAPQVLRGHVPRITSKLKPVGRLDGARRLDLAIGLPLRHVEQLTNLLEDIYQPSSPNFRRYLTPDGFASAFGPTEQDYQAVIAFAQAHGLTVKRTHSNRTLLDVSGTVGDIEKAFHVNMRTYQHPVEARTFFAPDVEPSPDLDTPLLAISGLDNYVKPRPQIRPDVRVLGGGGSTGGSGGGGGPGGSGSGGTYMGSDFIDAYAPGVTLTGSGQSLGLFELTGYDPDDISDYEGEAGLPPVNLQNILIDGFDGDDTNYEYAIECTADIEMSISMAPGLDNVLVYEGPTPLDEAPLLTNYIQPPVTTAQINDVLNRMATDDLANQLSCSYQMDINLSTVQIFQQFAAQGQSFFQGSGDAGGYPGAIDEPSDDPYLTVVGGTTLNTSSSGGWQSEVVWLTPASNDPLFGYSPEAASGGGVSLTYPIPTWQQGISMTANQGSTTMRNLPDVSLVANNVDVVWGNDYIGESFDLPEAGTSLATPLWAGFMALVNQQGASQGLPPVGFANPALYAIGKSTNYSACLHDITSGNNFSPNSPSKYSATTGYDLCSGWGTIGGSNLINALLAPPTENLLVTPPVGFTSFGAGGGPFTVTAQTFVLKNIGSNSLNWSLANTSLWLTVTATNSTLAAQGTTSVTASLNPNATSFLIGNYSANLVFVNSTDGTSQNREVDLYVGNGGFETGDFTDWNFIGSSDLDFALSGDDTDVGGTNALDGVPDDTFVHSGLYGAYLGEFPDAGSLSQTVATTAGQQYLVSFWLTSAAYQGSTTPNSFAANWDGSALFFETNLPAFGWTNMQYTVTASGSSATLEFDFNNTPAAFGLDDVSVESVSSPVPNVQSASLGGGNISLTWSGETGYSYQLQSTASLANPDWTTVSGAIKANGNTIAASVPTNSGSQQFYRVVLLPSN
jgi:subtilase family serine protease